MITFTLNACPKPTFKRSAPKRGKQGVFDAKTRKCIINRDKELCVRCGARYTEIHHIIFRSAGGAGTVDNGACVCKTCHDLAHSKREVREWFEEFRLRILEETKC
jgi:5-methylcytosine-specific restriction endonuclease McrA